MKIPNNMTEDQVVEEINVVVNRMSQRYTFYGYEVDDIKQEAFIICMDALERYDNKRPLENFLSVHLSNRLKNFVRDNHYMKDEEEKRRIDGKYTSFSLNLPRPRSPGTPNSLRRSRTKGTQCHHTFHGFHDHVRVVLCNLLGEHTTPRYKVHSHRFSCCAHAMHRRVGRAVLVPPRH